MVPHGAFGRRMGHLGGVWDVFVAQNYVFGGARGIFVVQTTIGDNLVVEEGHLGQVGGTRNSMVADFGG